MSPMSLRRTSSLLYAVVLVTATPLVASAQSQTSPRDQTPPPAQVTLPTVTVTAQKEPADPQNLPISVSPVPFDPLWNGGMRTIGDASIYAPNTYFTDFSARK